MLGLRTGYCSGSTTLPLYVTRAQQWHRTSCSAGWAARVGRHLRFILESQSLLAQLHRGWGQHLKELQGKMHIRVNVRGIDHVSPRQVSKQGDNNSLDLSHSLENRSRRYAKHHSQSVQIDCNMVSLRCHHESCSDNVDPMPTSGDPAPLGEQHQPAGCCADRSALVLHSEVETITDAIEKRGCVCSIPEKADSVCHADLPHFLLEVAQRLVSFGGHFLYSHSKALPAAGYEYAGT
mmetsp:Transcript_107831/g.198035  ORF Transcript_107831/g.198035 Transcript_107831/m.198035 type:complete len:236 (-) Transcript_107831:410-1117(-)